jgi:transglutaminase-like putative cysteine protease
MAVSGIEWAHWITPQPWLTLVLVMAVAAGWGLAGRRFSGWQSHAAAFFTGAVIAFWQALILMPSQPLGTRLESMVAALRSFWQAGGASPESVTVTFGVFLVALTWIAGYVSAWYLVRKRNPWPGAAMGALVVLVNLSNLPDSFGAFLFFGGYFLLSASLIAWCRLAGRPDPAGALRRYTRRVLVYAGTSLLCLVVLGSSLAWMVPAPRLSDLQTALAARMPWKQDIESSRLNVFAAVPSKQPISSAANLDEIDFGPLWHESDTIAYTVESPSPAYWRVHVFDTYGAAGWSNSQVSDYPLDGRTAWGDPPPAENTVTYNVTADIKTDVLLMTGDFVAANTPVQVHVGGNDIVGITIPRILSSGESYSVTSSVVSPSAGELAVAGTAYPPAITETYLQLPPDFPNDVNQLARRITRRVRTPYEKVKAIDDYLSNLTYSTKVGELPEGADGVEYFLFTQKSGFCLYFASAMAVMLRSVGVPARLAVGYLPGEPGNKPGEYILRDKSYHAWVQAYFPGYGWIDLEATPAGGSGTESQVPLDTPWVSPETIAQSPVWDPSQYAGLYGQPLVPPQADAGTAPSGASRTLSGPLPFAAALGRILVICIAGVILLAVVLTPFLALRNTFDRWLWYVDRGDLAETAYARMVSLAGMANLGPRPQQTPLEFAAELGAAFPEEAEDAARIARTYAGSRFRGKREGLSLFEEAEVLKARCRVYTRLLGRLSIVKRVFGRWRS